jgi:TPP-dependent pyruvate/acetoin dehydrogenase alpha subunit
MLAEIFGRATGYCKGKGGSMHLADMGRGMLGADGIVGGGIPIAAGAALGCRVLGHDRVVVCFFGDGATNQGSFHEAANFAAVNKLAVVFVCENNHWALSAGFEATTAVDNVADRAAAYSMPGHIVDGNDVEAVHDAAVTAIERARTGEGPSLVECKTYRWEGHSVFPRPDPRPAQEIEDWRKRDPIAALLQVLLDNGILDADGQSQIEEEVAALIDEAESFARSSPLPEPETAFDDIYV